jgi:hypothetical protein
LEKQLERGRAGPGESKNEDGPLELRRPDLGDALQVIHDLESTDQVADDLVANQLLTQWGQLGIRRIRVE